MLSGSPPPLILWGAVIERGFAGQSWPTFRQALALGGHVRKGERGTTVVYADRFVPKDEKRRAHDAGGHVREPDERMHQGELAGVIEPQSRNASSGRGYGRFSEAS